MSWQLGSMAVIALALAGGFGWYERLHPPSKLVALVAALAALAIAGRVLFAAIPNVQATTDVTLLSGYALGAGPGFAVGALAALASNVFLGQGPWTPWQMLGWGMAGVIGAALGRASGRRGSRLPLALACAFAGFAFGAWMDLFTLLNFSAEPSGESYLAIAATSFPFNAAHAIGNFFLCLFFGPDFVRLLARFRARLQVRWRALDTGAPPLALLTALMLGVGMLFAQSTRAAGDVHDALRYLVRSQNDDGGFGGAPRQSSSQLITGWAVIGIEAGGRNPLDVRSRGNSAIDYMRRNAGQLTDTGELERTILALRGAGSGARSFAGRDLVEELLRRHRSAGSFDGLTNLTAFGIMALRAAGRSPASTTIRRSASWLTRQQNTDGGFSFAKRGGASDVDDTGAVLQALAAARRAHTDAVGHALGYLKHAQNPDGGFAQLVDGRSNAQSTAFAAQGLVAVGRDPARFASRGGRSAIAYLDSLRQGDGSFRYSRTSAQTPIWVTAQVIPALERKPLPLRPVARAFAAQRASARKGSRRHGNRGRRDSVQLGAHSASSSATLGRLLGTVLSGSKAARPAVHVRAPTGRADRSRGRGWLALGAGLVVAAAMVWVLRHRIRR